MSKVKTINISNKVNGGEAVGFTFQKIEDQIITKIFMNSYGSVTEMTLTNIDPQALLEAAQELVKLVENK